MAIDKEGGEEASRECPNCHSKKTVNNGLRNITGGQVQRFLCKNCGHRFSETATLSRIYYNNVGRQVCVSRKGAKNLAKMEPLKAGLAGATENVDIIGKLVQYSAWMEKQRYSQATIKLNLSCLKALCAKGAKLLDTENAKEVIAKEKS